MIVCGCPGSVRASCAPSRKRGCSWSAPTTRSTSRKATTAVADADAKTIAAAPAKRRGQRRGLVGGVVINKRVSVAMLSTRRRHGRSPLRSATTPRPHGYGEKRRGDEAGAKEC